MLSIVKALLLFTVIAVRASPVQVDIEARRALDVFVPPITYPTEGVRWVIGKEECVEWNVSQAPVNITNKIGRILLRKGEIISDTVLASNFSILLEKIPVKVPVVIPGDDYSLVLFGDSGNYSPNFMISY